MSSIECSLFQFRFVIHHCDLINRQTLNISFNPIAPLSSINFLFELLLNLV